MQWSKFSMMFKSSKGGFLLYNSGSGSLIHISDDTEWLIRKIKSNPNMDFSNNPDLYFKLRLGGFLVEDSADNDLVRVLKMKRLTSNYTDTQLLLTIAPTRDCNFACEYCYEQNRAPSEMSDEAEDKLIQFINKYKFVRKINITWYGGEPLLALDKIKSLNEKIAAMGIDYESQIITNGYCLTADAIAVLKELKILNIQITVDGAKDTHDKRRYLKCGGATYDSILGNIDRLMCSGWNGRLNLRVNIDKHNSNEFAEVYKLFESKYPKIFGNLINVYPGFVINPEMVDCSSHFNSNDKGKFLTGLSRDFGINPLTVFPHMTMGGCTMTKKNAYVVGPDGELYKCWRDLGNNAEAVGSINGSTYRNTSLIAEGMVGASYLHNETCEKCTFFPVCDGGCTKIRLLNNRDKGTRDTCTYFKHNIHELLEIHCKQTIG